MGRKPIHKPENIAVGEQFELIGKLKRFSWQYLNNFNKRGKAKFKHVRTDDDKVYLERIK